MFWSIEKGPRPCTYHGKSYSRTWVVQEGALVHDKYDLLLSLTAQPCDDCGGGVKKISHHVVVNTCLQYLLFPFIIIFTIIIIIISIIVTFIIIIISP